MRKKIYLVINPISISIITLLVPVICIINFSAYFQYKFDSLNLKEEFSRFGEQELKSYLNSILDFINWRKDNLDSNFFTDQEIVHLNDVKSLVLFIYSIFIAIVAILVISIHNNSKEFLKSIKYSILLNFFLFLVCILCMIRFDILFDALHKILFRNDFWLLDPESSNLIKFFPIAIFEEIAIYIGFFVIITSILLWIIMKKRIKKY